MATEQRQEAVADLDTTVEHLARALNVLYPMRIKGRDQVVIAVPEIQFWLLKDAIRQSLPGDQLIDPAFMRHDRWFHYRDFRFEISAPQGGRG